MSLEYSAIFIRLIVVAILSRLSSRSDFKSLMLESTTLLKK